MVWKCPYCATWHIPEKLTCNNCGAGRDLDEEDLPVQEEYSPAPSFYSWDSPYFASASTRAPPPFSEWAAPDPELSALRARAQDLELRSPVPSRTAIGPDPDWRVRELSRPRSILEPFKELFLAVKDALTG